MFWTSENKENKKTVKLCSFQYRWQTVQFSHSVVSDSLRPCEPQHARPPCPSPTAGVYPNPCPLSRWYHPTALILCRPLLLLPSTFPSMELNPVLPCKPRGGVVRLNPEKGWEMLALQGRFRPLGQRPWVTVGVSWRRRVRTCGRGFKQFLFSMSECHCDACTLLHSFRAHDYFFRINF